MYVTNVVVGATGCVSTGWWRGRRVSRLWFYCPLARAVSTTRSRRRCFSFHPILRNSRLFIKSKTYMRVSYLFILYVRPHANFQHCRNSTAIPFYCSQIALIRVRPVQYYVCTYVRISRIRIQLPSHPRDREQHYRVLYHYGPCPRTIAVSERSSQFTYNF